SRGIQRGPRARREGRRWGSMVWNGEHWTYACGRACSFLSLLIRVVLVCCASERRSPFWKNPHPGPLPHVGRRCAKRAFGRVRERGKNGGSDGASPSLQ